ncbi:Pre-mRNA-processing factor 39 [Trichinella pseudospiralis]|uniref:Pre-mRNA-processing factor 39 n=1 Tax=Trichinella pseudospiralis TaxID=6337 RepID=A0A0V1JBZ6_TRIPS|nr:Pre-mRNA-processing factor 39 [Trichinella pseudospiralis]
MPETSVTIHDFELLQLIYMDSISESYCYSRSGGSESDERASGIESSPKRYNSRRRSSERRSRKRSRRSTHRLEKHHRRSRSDRRHHSSRSRSGSSRRKRRKYSSSERSDSDERSSARRAHKYVDESTNRTVQHNGEHDVDAHAKALTYYWAKNDIEAVRLSFDTFLARYPLCFGYWKKYACLELKNHNEEKCIEVYERGVSVIPLSVNLWMSYIDFLKRYEQSDEHLRAIYQRAIMVAGREFCSKELWMDYIEWEYSNKNFKAVMAAHDQLLTIPTEYYKRNYSDLCALIDNHHPEELLDEEEYRNVFNNTCRMLKAKNIKVFTNDEDSTALLPDKDKEKRALTKPAIAELRLRIKESRGQLFEELHAAMSRRLPFENRISRPYFHVKPLERSQLDNWKKYCEFEIREGNRERIQVLFERCLIACAMYEEMWIMVYANYMETVSDVETRRIYSRACQTHYLSKKPNIHLSWAAFEERHGNFDEAAHVLDSYEKMNPGNIMIAIRRLGLERRQLFSNHANAAAAATTDCGSLCALYERFINNETLDLKMRSFYAIKYARFQLKMRNNPEEAERIILNALEKDKHSIELYLQLVDLAYAKQPFNLDLLLQTLDRAIASPDLPDSVKLQFSQRKMTALEDFSPDVAAIQSHYEAHVQFQNLVKENDKDKAATPRNGPPIENKMLPRIPGNNPYPSYFNYYYQNQPQYPTPMIAGQIPHHRNAHYGNYMYPPNVQQQQQQQHHHHHHHHHHQQQQQQQQLEKRICGFCPTFDDKNHFDLLPSSVMSSCSAY